MPLLTIYINQLNNIMKTKQIQTKNIDLIALERRMNVDCNYSVISTLLLKFLREKKVLNIISTFAKKSGVKLHKNYSIIALKISYYLHLRKRIDGGITEGLCELFNYLEKGLEDCIESKYSKKPKLFKNLALAKVQKVIKVLRQVFEKGNLQDEASISKIIVNIYKKNGHKKLQQKYAWDISKIIKGVLKYGEEYERLTEDSEPINFSLSSENDNKKDQSSLSNIEASFDEEEPVENLKNEDMLGEPFQGNNIKFFTRESEILCLNSEVFSQPNLFQLECQLMEQKMPCTSRYCENIGQTQPYLSGNQFDLSSLCQDSQIETFLKKSFSFPLLSLITQSQQDIQIDRQTYFN